MPVIMSGMIAAQDDPQVLPISSQAAADLLQAVVEKGTSFRFRASGRSMLPAIRDGDVLTISPAAPGEPRVGQVTACRIPASGILLVHRVIRRKSNRALIKADRGGEVDGWVPDTDLLGVVTHVERDGREKYWPWKRVGGRLAFLVVWKLRTTRLVYILFRHLKRKKRMKGRTDERA